MVLDTLGIDDMSAVICALRQWQRDGATIQLHPGDIGWHYRFGADTTAAATRTWSRDGRMLAVGLLDGREVLRLAIAPEAEHDGELAQELLADVSEPGRGVLQQGAAAIEARSGAAFRGLLADHGWQPDELWAPLNRDLTEPVEDCGLRIEVIGPGRAPVRTALQRAALDGSTFTEERWHAMAAGPAYPDARCLVAYDAEDTPVAAATVWSAGKGRPGLLEPVGAHRDHRGHGYGKAITLAAAAALREMGSSSASVCTRRANGAAVGTYRSAGFEQLPDAPDFQRTG